MSTISSPGVLLGEQRPRVSSAPPSISSAGTEAVELAASAGLVLDPWQAHVLDVALAERADGKWAAFEVGLLVARQNGKGAVLEALELAGLFLFGERLILHSAHEFKTAQEAFLRVKALIEGSDEFRRQVARVRTSHGEEGIELRSGQRLRFVARSRSSGRGFSGDRIILDEAQELPRSAMGALLPTLSARPNPQVVYTGTVPDPDNDCEHFLSLRDRGRKGGDSTLAWLEWSPGEEHGIDDEQGWAAANPALGLRITSETVQRERNSLGDEEFARERLSMWTDSAVKPPVDLLTWAGLEDMGDERPSPVAFSIQVNDDRSWTSIGLAGRRSDGATHVQIVQAGRGTGWVVDRVAELVMNWKPLAVALHPQGPSGSLLAPLAGAGVDVLKVGHADMAQACGLFADTVTERTVRHAGQPQVNAALAGARWRSSGDSRVLVPKDDSKDIGPLRAVVLALYGLTKGATRPSRSGVVW